MGFERLFGATDQKPEAGTWFDRLRKPSGRVYSLLELRRREKCLYLAAWDQKIICANEASPAMTVRAKIVSGTGRSD